MDLDNVVDPDPNVQNYDRVPVSYKTGAAQLPLLFRVGVSYEAALGRFGVATVSADVNHPSNSTESVDLGFEYGFGGMFFLRGGYQSLFEQNSISGLTLGGGVNWYTSDNSLGIRVDYSWGDWGILTNSQRFSVDIIF
jgi:hypothetical protein